MKTFRYLTLSLALVALVMVIGNAAMAQAVQPIQNPRTWADNFFHTLQKNPAGAYAALKSSTLHPDKVDAVQQASGKIVQVFGPMIGADFIEQAAVGDAVLRLTYLVLHQRGPVVYQLVLYAPSKGSWHVMAMDIEVNADQFPFKPAK